jgi:hypothetical protein
MNTDRDTTTAPVTSVTSAPSADFVRAISDLLKTDPTDLLAELGYYERSKRPIAGPVDISLIGK